MQHLQNNYKCKGLIMKSIDNNAKENKCSNITIELFAIQKKTITLIWSNG
jgi:hypothetical protein